MKEGIVDLPKGEYAFDTIAWLKVGEVVRNAGLEWDSSDSVDKLILKTDYELVLRKKKRKRSKAAQLPTLAEGKLSDPETLDLLSPWLKK